MQDRVECLSFNVAIVFIVLWDVHYENKLLRVSHDVYRVWGLDAKNTRGLAGAAWRRNTYLTCTKSDSVLS